MPALSPDQVNTYLVKKLYQDLVIDCDSNTQVVIKDGSRAGADDGSVIMEAAADITVDITNVGVKNGLDDGSEASDTWYYLYLIFNPDTEEVAGLLSASVNAPTQPSGFTKKRLVGVVRNDGSSNFRKFIQMGRNVTTALYIDLLVLGPALIWAPLNLDAIVPTSISKLVQFGNLVQGDNPLTGGGAHAYLSIDGIGTGSAGTIKHTQLSPATGNFGGFTFVNITLREYRVWYRVHSVGDLMTIRISSYVLTSI